MLHKLFLKGLSLLNAAAVQRFTANFALTHCFGYPTPLASLGRDPRILFTSAKRTPRSGPGEVITTGPLLITNLPFRPSPLHFRHIRPP